LSEGAFSSASPVSSVAEPGIVRPVTTTDAWKLFAIIIVLIDHTGLFFDPNELWWRLFGRLASPVFFFFIGFARTRRVPWTWVAFGLVLTATDYLTSAGSRLPLINILLNFALVRLALPWVEAHIMPVPWRLAALVIVSAGLIPVLDPVLEYGGEGWLWALFGLAHRLFLDRGAAAARWRRDLLGITAGLVYIIRERSDFGFHAVQSVLLAVFIAGLVLALMRFRRAELAWQPPAVLRLVFTVTGRRTLEIYAVTLLAMQLIAFTLNDAAAADTGADDGDAE
jgi:uncharacterized membrane protein